MFKIGNNNKGIVLIVSYFVLVVLLGLTAITILRGINESRLAQRSNYSLQAFYEAEAGIAYAYAEAALQGFEWYTHENNATAVTAASDVNIQDVNFIHPVPRNIANSNINATGDYSVNDTQGNERFRVKAYPERILGNLTGVTVIHSQATVNNITRSVEYRLARESAYQYFFFYPDTHTFGTATFDGRNFGGIHVNGDIMLRGNPSFNFLTKLTSGWLTEDKGYIYRERDHKFRDLHGEDNYPTTVSNPMQLSDMYLRVNSQYYTGDTYFTTGDINDPNLTTTLPYYLSGSDAEYYFDRYDGDGSNTTPMHYEVSNGDLKNLATYELSKGTGTVGLLSNSDEVEINNASIGQGTEAEIFEKLYDYVEQITGEKEGFWIQYWNKWRENHANDYQLYHDATTLTGGEDWERRFFWAAYDWDDGDGNLEPANGVPDGINREWWEDLSYGDDRALLTGDQAPAQRESYYTGGKLDSYFLNTKKQPTAWDNWLSDPNGDGTVQLDQEGKNQTLVQDITQGGTYLNPGTIFDEEEQATQSELKAKALEGGIYIGEVTGSPDSILQQIITETQFYNVRHPAIQTGSGITSYKPSNIVVIDVQALRQELAAQNRDFNGVIYVELDNYPWSIGNSFDQKADGVMLVNGERLPNGGLSIVSPNNVFIKGNYNLDPNGNEDRNRDRDDADVISRVEAKYFGVPDFDLLWQKAEIITKRAVYTLSEDFPEPSYMPMALDRKQQYDDEQVYVQSQDFVSGDRSYPADSWVPSPTWTYDTYSRV
ncbi:MAG: pilus assembly PilX N-terminal domain-containing protein, partial [Omnitrophica bacterium]|nr:pilus assembly PilX N-terminal domain-containing protein [Candidatus Omnitrophota bacterium]